MTQPNPHSGSSTWTGNTNGPAQQQPNWQPPAGQWGQPAPQQSLGASLSRVNRNFWVFLAATVATFVTAFLPVVVGSSSEGFGLLSTSFNWWGQMSVSAPVGSDLLDALLEEEMPGEYYDFRTVVIAATVFVIALQALATFFAYKEKQRTGAIIGIVIFLLQLLYSVAVLVAMFNTAVPGARISPGAGLWLWIIIAVVGLVMSIRMLSKRNGNQQPPQTWGGPQAPQPNQPNNWGQPGYQWGQPGN
ncbi:hypothetical protein [Corynebacterium lujinxingii]|uniref:Uncharacterized protein n=1 Tax=Corynebacterium lujinxingii TaxID=2763010 RepID=A0A7H0JXB9_9CORY|nr:hypothetical protein [Corynebacterium lujinxingii]MBC3177884.1 hypothetical protein [Corynebacterium lujinxingii]NNO09871.1 hypothetical protein [Corynebacterium lujinxingii]QNP89685.1 hypothetical protein IAU68_08250 [Corynebacterium lujinxingii]